MKTGYLDQALSIYQDLSRALTIKSLCRKILDTVNSKTVAERTSIIIKSGDNFILKASQKRNSGDTIFQEGNDYAMDHDLPLSVLHQIKSPKNVIVVDINKVNDKVKAERYIKENNISFLNFIPLWNDDTLIGFLMIEQYQNINTPSEQIKFLQVLAPQIAILLQNAVAIESFKGAEATTVEETPTTPSTSEPQEVQKLDSFALKTIHEIGQIIASTDSIENMTETVFEKINTVLDAQTLDIGLVNNERHRLEFPGTYEDGERLPFNYCKLDEENRLATICLKGNKTIHINDFDNEILSIIPDYNLNAPKRVGKKVNSIIYATIQYKGKPVGVFTVQTEKLNAYSKQDRLLIEGISSYIGIAIDNLNLNKEKQNQNIRSQEQEEELTQAYTTLKNLGEIGQDITSNLSIERIADTAYESLNSMIDAPLFSMGIYNKARGVLDISTNIENGEKLPPKTIRLTDNNKLSVICFKTLKEIIINDFISEYNQHVPNTELPTQDSSKLPQSLIYIPLIGKEGTLGFITIQNYQSNSFDERALNLMRNIAIYIGIALDNALTYEGLEEIVADRTAELQKQKQEVEANRDQIEQSYKNVQLLSEIGLSLSSSLSTESIIKTVYENVQTLIGGDAFGLGIYNHRKQQIEFRGAMEKGKELPDFIHSMSDDTRLSSICLKRNEEIVINDITKEIYQYLDSQDEVPTVGEMPQSIIYIPMRAEDKLIGVISLQSFKKNAYTELHVDLLRNIAIISAIAIDKAGTYEKIERQKEELQVTSQKVTESIRYAKQIQSSILPNRTLIRQLLPDSFIFHKPKDIVSGDFFWFFEHDSRVYIATVDCNSNGVPGAMMSIIGTSLFREIVEIQGVVCPGEILKAMNERIVSHLNQNHSENTDALDVSLVVMDKSKKTLEFAGANTSMAKIKDGKFFLIKGMPICIGGEYNEEKFNEIEYKKHTFDLTEDATYYLFTDGYQKQVGGEEKVEFGKENFLKLLFSNHKEEKSKQRTAIRRAFNDWMEHELVQTDDVLVLGFNPTLS
ncbi:GAF domain-containing SpoIIE family protein phosphatase [Flammeovirga agarivorans]|uniref:GAF domain-containing protein n=1 Tax=Flammeovirga agarivorans TaxID=2726742 RepID=A0A7X8SIP2_9BACT|nr:GAF domain-containing protein [Flammeovirga agarivorans]NLR90956.1 GAF domain-containing protein [Flammeovirga agarivorans]